MAWTRNGTPHTLSSTADTMTISDLTANKFNVILHHKIPSGAVDASLTFNNNTNSVYARRKNQNGTGDNTVISQSDITMGVNGATPDFLICYICSIAGEEKLMIAFQANSMTAGAGTAPWRAEYVGKFVPSPDADITRVDTTNFDSGDYDSGSNLSALGTD